MNRRLVTGLALLMSAVIVSPAPAQPPDEAKGRPRAFLGVAVEAAREGKSGAAVREVTPASPAAKAELKAGDVILKVGDKDGKDPDDLIAAVSEHKPGEKLTFRVLRDGQEKDLVVTLGEQPPATATTPRERPAGFLGVLTAPLSPEAMQGLGVAADRGAVVVEVMPSSPAAKAGLRPGDVILTAGGKEVPDPAGLRQAVQQAGAGKELALTVLRGRENHEIKARLEEPRWTASA